MLTRGHPPQEWHAAQLCLAPGPEKTLRRRHISLCTLWAPQITPGMCQHWERHIFVQESGHKKGGARPQPTIQRLLREVSPMCAVVGVCSPACLVQASNELSREWWCSRLSTEESGENSDPPLHVGKKKRSGPKKLEPKKNPPN